MSIYREAYSGKRVLVTGGAGAIGSNLCRELAGLGAQVLILDDLSSGFLWNVPKCANVEFVEGDILDEVKLKRVFFDHPQIVFHLAGFFANQNSVDHPERDLLVNGMGTLRVLEYSLLSGAERFVFASSSSTVYGGDAPLPTTEDYVSLRLTTPYQATKMLGELYCNFFFHHYGLKTVKTRFFNNFGPGEVPGRYRNVIPNFIYRALKGLPLTITGSGEETRDFTYVSDTVDALLRSGIFEAAVGQEFNVASGKETSIGDLALAINDLAGNSAGIQYVGRRKWDNKSRRWGSTKRASDMLGFNAKISFSSGLQQTISWFRDHWEEINASADFGGAIPISQSQEAVMVSASAAD